MRRLKEVLAVGALAALAGSGTAHASDAVQAAIAIPAGEDQPRPVVVENGTTTSEGTYAIGTIHLLYTFEGYQFPAGDFAEFDLGLGIQASTQKPNTAYPVNALELEQTGSSNLTLTPETSSFLVGSAAWNTWTRVRISIPTDAPSEDGATLVGNLQIKSPNGSHLDTVTTVKVKITLVHPTSCLKLYNFVTDTTLETAVSSLVVNINKNKQTISATNPYGQLSNNVLVVNTCASARTFDARASLDPYFSTSPAGNPGNAVFTFLSSTETDPANVFTTSWSAGSAQGQSLCLGNVTLAAHGSWLATIKMAVKNVSSVGFTAAGTFSFGAEVLEGGSSCTVAFGEDVTPANPVTAAVTYTTK